MTGPPPLARLLRARVALIFQTMTFMRLHGGRPQGIAATRLVRAREQPAMCP
jgi:hypothetical protein